MPLSTTDNPNPIIVLCDSKDDLFVIPPRVIAGILGIANQVDQGFATLCVFPSEWARHDGIVPYELDLMAFQGTDIDSNGVLHQFPNVEQFGHSGNAGVTLLQVDDFPGYEGYFSPAGWPPA